MTRRIRLSIFLLLFFGLGFVIILYKSQVLPKFLSPFQIFGLGQNGDQEILSSIDILAHPEKYPLNVFATSPASKPRSKASNDSWKRIVDGLYVYSAFEDVRSKHDNTVIRIVSLVHKDTAHHLDLRCLLKYKGSSNHIVGERSALTVLHEQHNGTYLTALLFCFCKRQGVITGIALHDGSKAEIKWLQLNKLSHEISNDISVCVKPIYGANFDGNLLAEFIAYYEVVGVKSFIFYDYDIAPKLLAYLKSLKTDKEISVTILNWKLPISIATKTWQYGQMTSIQDCISRSAEEKYVLLVDVDEFLVPRQHFTLSEMMEDLEKKIKRPIGSYIYRQSFFCKSPNVTGNSFPLVTSTRIMREDKIWPAKMRSKVMVKPQTVLESGIHFVWKHLQRWKSGQVPWELAMIHHYNHNDCDRNSTLIEDRTAEPFKIEIMLSNAMTKWREIT